MTTTTSSAEPSGRTGAPVELATYDADIGGRRVIGQRVDGIVRITDAPANGTGRSYVVETGLKTKAELDALVEDYLAKAKRLGYVPMHGWF